MESGNIILTKNNAIRYHDRLLLTFFFMSILSSIIVNIIPYSYIDPINVWSEEYINGLRLKAISFTSMFYYLLKIRTILFASLIFFIFTTICRKVIFLFVIYLGISWGTVSAVLLMNYGISGIKSVFFLLLPHYFFYTLAYYMMFMKFDIAKKEYRKNKISMLIVFILSVLTFIAGVMSEAYVNTFVFVKFIP